MSSIEWPDLGHIPVRYAKGQKNGLPKYAGDSKLTFSVHASWTHEANREILINRAAVGVGESYMPSTSLSTEANSITGRLVSRKWGNPNCYAVEGEADYCNIGYIYRVNLPDVNRVKNFILLRFSGGGPITDYFRCCSSQKFLEFDDYAKEMKESFSLDYSQQARCLIVDDITCGRCGEKCNTCNEKCHDGCIKGKC